MTTRRIPSGQRFPWEILIVAVLFLALAGSGVVAALSQAVWKGPVLPAIPPVVRVAVPPAPTATPVPMITPVPTPTPIPTIEVNWVSVGKVRYGAGQNLPIPWEKFSFVSGPTAQADLGFFTQHSHGRGDGEVFLFRTKEEFYFTPNGGKSWFRVNGPSSSTISIAEPTGATSNGKVILFAVTEPEPWVTEYWRADIPLAKLEGLRP